MALAAEPNVVFPAETSPARATSSRIAFEQAISDVMARVVGRFLVDVEALGLAELDRHNALVAAGGPSVLDKSALIGDARDQGASVFVIRSLWERITDTAVEGAIDAMLSALPLPLRWRVFERMVRERFLSTIDEPDVFELAYTIIDTAVRDVTENGVSRRVAERTMKEELSYLKPTGEATEFAWRAERLARTASTTLYNDAMIDQLAEDGFTHKLWVTYHDDKVRETHQQADGMSIPIEQPFIVGGSPMMQPGDTTAPIGEWINCRCVIVGENGPTTPGIDWSIPVMTESERIEAGFPADISLAASGRAFATMNAITRTLRGNPTQARAPKGTRIGGRWIETPTGLLHTAHSFDPVFEGMENPADFGAPGGDRATAESIVFPALEAQDNPMAHAADSIFMNDEITQATRQALADGVAGGVNVNMNVDAFNELGYQYMAGDVNDPHGLLNLEGVMERVMNGPGYGDEVVPPQAEVGDYVEARRDYEANVLGEAPIYGMGVLYSDNATAQGKEFGPITVHLKDDVLNRTGWVAGDGVESGARPIMTHEIPTASREELIAASGWMNPGARTEETGYDGDMSNWKTNFDKMPYVEAQVFGGVTTDDIEYVNIHPAFENGVSSDAKQLFEDRGIEIRYDRENEFTQASPLEGESWVDKMIGTKDIGAALDFTGDPKDDPKGFLKSALSASNDYDNYGVVERVSDVAQDLIETHLEGRTYGREDTFTVDIGDATLDSGTLEYRGDILNEKGYGVGEFQRTISEDGEGGLRIHHDLMRIHDEDEKGKGFSTDFSRASEAMYRELGIDRIDLNASLSDGGYTWARAGYQWQPGTSLRLREGQLDSAIEYAKTSGNKEHEEILVGWKEHPPSGYSNVIDTDTVTMDFGTPQDMLDVLTENGESIMKGSEWYGEKFLNEEDMAIYASAQHQAWQSSRKRSDMLYDFCDKYGVDYDEEWPQPTEILWQLLDRQACDAWESTLGNPTTAATGLTASAAPTQARAPKGASNGGQWVDTPGAMLDKAEKATPFLIAKETFPPPPEPDTIASHKTNRLLDPDNPADHDEIRARADAVNKAWVGGDNTDFGEEPWLDAVYKTLGTDDATPTLVKSLRPTSDHIYRGVKQATDFKTNVTKTSAEQREQFRTGDHHAGYGIYGNGSYFWRGDNHQRDAQNYSDDNSMLAGEWKPGARLYRMDSMTDAGVPMRQKMHDILGNHHISDDISSTLALLGYDGMQLSGQYDPSMDLVFNRDAMNVLDRDHVYGQDPTQEA